VKLYETAEAGVEDFAVLFEFWKGGDATEEETKEAYEQAIALLDDAEFKATLNEPEDELPAVLQRRIDKPLILLQETHNDNP